MTLHAYPKNRWVQFGTRYDLRLRFEFKPADLWIGVFVKRQILIRAKFYDLWVCVVPMFPIHLAWDVEAPALTLGSNEVCG